MKFNFNVASTHEQTCEKVFSGKDKFYQEILVVPGSQDKGIQESSAKVIFSRLSDFWHAYLRLKEQRDRLYRELPASRFLSEAPLSSNCYAALALVGLIGMEIMSWMNGAYFAKETMGQDRYWGALAMASPIIATPFILKFLTDKIKQHEAKINRVLMVAFAVAALGFFWQFGSKFAVLDPAQATFHLDWSGEGGNQQPAPPASYKAYLAFQLMVECLASFVFARWLAKFSGPQLDPKFEKVSEELGKLDKEIEEVRLKHGMLSFHYSRLTHGTGINVNDTHAYQE